MHKHARSACSAEVVFIRTLFVVVFVLHSDNNKKNTCDFLCNTLNELTDLVDQWIEFA